MSDDVMGKRSGPSAGSRRSPPEARRAPVPARRLLRLSLLAAALGPLAGCAWPGSAAGGAEAAAGPTLARSLHAAVAGTPGAEARLARTAPADRTQDPATEALRLASGPVLAWTVRSGTSVRAELDLWAGQAGWQLRWQSEHAYPIQAGARFTGTFPQAAYALIGAFQRADPPPVVTFYPANKVLTVHSLSTGEEEED